MTELAKTIKLHIHVKPKDRDKLVEAGYMESCEEIAHGKKIKPMGLTGMVLTGLENRLAYIS